MKAKTFLRVGCYVRVSTENQIENYSIDEQVERLKSFCLAKDWEIYKFFTDGGYSGGNIHRPALEQLLEAVRSGKLDMVVVYKLDRLSRSQKDTLLLIEDEFLSHGVEFVSMSENFDTSTPFGRAMIGILSVFAQLEKDQITERFTMGRIGRCKAGYYHGGSTAPTGYRYIDGLLVVDEVKAAQVREVFDLFLSGRSINSIQSHMHDLYGGWNSHSQIIYLLKNSVYIGKVKFKGESYRGVHQPLVSLQVFTQAQELFQSSLREGQGTCQKTPFRAGYMLSSLVYCSLCGARYSAVAGYYKCYSRSKCGKKFIKDPNCKNQNWEIGLLDALLINEIRKLAYNLDNVNSIFDAQSEGTPDINRAELFAKSKELGNQLARMIDLYQIGGIPLEQICGRIKALQSEKDGIDRLLSSQRQNTCEKKLRFIGLISGLEEVLSSDSAEEKRLFISGIVESIWINEESVSIRWRI